VARGALCSKAYGGRAAASSGESPSGTAVSLKGCGVGVMKREKEGLEEGQRERQGVPREVWGCPHATPRHTMSHPALLVISFSLTHHGNAILAFHAGHQVVVGERQVAVVVGRWWACRGQHTRSGTGRQEQCCEPHVSSSGCSPPPLFRLPTP
jgi:hypothetical protein